MTTVYMVLTLIKRVWDGYFDTTKIGIYASVDGNYGLFYPDCRGFKTPVIDVLLEGLLSLSADLIGNIGEIFSIDFENILVITPFMNIRKYSGNNSMQ